MMTTTTTVQLDKFERVTNRRPENLEELLFYMQRHEARERYAAVDERGVSLVPMLDWTDLPKYGGDPVDGPAVWSWDENRVLVGPTADFLQIVERRPVAAGWIMCVDKNYIVGAGNTEAEATANAEKNLEAKIASYDNVLLLPATARLIKCVRMEEYPFRFTFSKVATPDGVVADLRFTNRSW